MSAPGAPVFTLPPLNAIVDADAAVRAGWHPAGLAIAFVRGGARFLQFRAKSMSGRDLLDTARQVVAAARAGGARVVVNDRADIARIAHADGVHVGQEDLAPSSIRSILGSAAVVGLSTHSVGQIEGALSEPVSYLAVGPVFGTTTKSTGYEPIGLDLVRTAARLASERGLPLIAIGGITLETAPAVLAAGAASVAVIGDLLATGDPEARARAYVERLRV